MTQLPSTHTNLPSAQTQKNKWANSLFAASLGNDFSAKDDIFAYFNQKKTLISSLNTEGWNVGDSFEIELKNKIEQDSILLKDFLVYESCCYSKSP